MCCLFFQAHFLGQYIGGLVLISLVILACFETRLIGPSCFLQQETLPSVLVNSRNRLERHLRYGDTLLASKGEHLK